MKGWRAYAAVVAVFLVGTVAGAAAMHLYRVRIERSIASSPEPVAQAAVMLLDRELSLSDDQEARVRDEIIRSRRQFIAEHPSLLVDVRTMFESTQERIGAILTPGQRVTYDRLVAERRAILEKAIVESR